MNEIAKKNAGMNQADSSAITPINGELLRDVRISLEARLGRSEMTVADLMDLKSGAVVTLDKSLADHAQLYLNGVLVARGEIVAVGDNYGVRIVEIAQGD